MPVELSYPGVYVEEVASGVRTITGVATSIAAFVGQALRGPVDEPVTVRSFADFEREFGGLWRGSHLGYSVKDFFDEGGSTAIIVRVFRGDADDTREITVGKVKLSARSAGAWGRRLRAETDLNVDSGEFNLTVDLMPDANFDATTQPETREVFRNLSRDPASPRRVDLIVNAQSRLARVATLPTSAVVADGPSAKYADSKVTDGAVITSAEVQGNESQKTGIFALEKADLFNLLVIPPYSGVDTTLVGDRTVDDATLTAAVRYATRRRAIVIVDRQWDFAAALAGGLAFLPEKNAAAYFPLVRHPDPLLSGALATFAPSGAIAGVIARTDATRGVWKAAAGTDAQLTTVTDLSIALTDREIGSLNPLGINCLRVDPVAGPTVWGARTRAGADRAASEWKYLPIRRTALFIEESLSRGLQWAVFEPNDEPLYAQIRLNVGSFMYDLFRRSAFEGRTARQAFFVKCSTETTTALDREHGIVNILVGFAPLKPAEFVVIRLQQMAGQLTV